MLQPPLLKICFRFAPHFTPSSMESKAPEGAGGDEQQSGQEQLRRPDQRLNWHVRELKVERSLLHRADGSVRVSQGALPFLSFLIPIVPLLRSPRLHANTLMFSLHVQRLLRLTGKTCVLVALHGPMAVSVLAGFLLWLARHHFRVLSPHRRIVNIPHMQVESRKEKIDRAAIEVVFKSRASLNNQSTPMRIYCHTLASSFFVGALLIFTLTTSILSLSLSPARPRSRARRLVRR